jgi:phosphopantothenoylcysteine decarboxylase/phosphopantothenate--cysteine ligase
MSILRDRPILLAVTGGIAAYKAAELASSLVQAGVRLDVILSQGALRFVQPLTFEALTRGRVHTDLWEPWTAGRAGHVTLAAETSCLVVAPATANTIARLALGLADDLLGAVNLATTAPLVVAPAMEHHMYHHPATQLHLRTLSERGATIVAPHPGRLASGASGDGRLAPTHEIIGAIRKTLGRTGPLAGRRVVVSAGGTQEPIDPVRYIGNRSSGQMGYAIAQAALDRGAAVTLVSGPTSLEVPWGADVVFVQTAAEMQSAIEASTMDADVLIMAAAVADFRPKVAAQHKMKKTEDQPAPTIELERTTDILASIQRPGLLKIGFAAETQNLVESAQAKLAAKGLDLIVANDAVAAIGAPTNTAVFIEAGKEPEFLPTLPKGELAEAILDRVTSLLSARGR